MYHMVVIRETDLARETAKDVMRRARRSVGGEGELSLTRAEKGEYGALFSSEEHRDAFLVSLRRRGVKFTLENIESSKVKESVSKTESRPNPPMNMPLSGALLRAAELLIQELRKK